MSDILTGVQLFAATLKSLKEAFKEDKLLEIKGFGLVKGVDSSIKKAQLSFDIFNNRESIIVKNIDLELNDNKIPWKQEYKFDNIYSVSSFKPAMSFILGEKCVKELNLEFESASPLMFEENNNLKIIIYYKDGKKDIFEYGVELENDFIKRLNLKESLVETIVFRCNHFEIGQ